MGKPTPAGKAILALIFVGFALGGAWIYLRSKRPPTSSAEAASEVGTSWPEEAQGPGSKGVLATGSGSSRTATGVVPGAAGTAGTAGTAYNPGRRYKVALSQWPGHMGGVVGNGGLTTQPGSVAAELGLDLEIVFIEEPTPKNTALQTGAVDAVWQVVDEMPLNLPGYKAAGIEPRAFVQIDWSRGGDACVASKEIKRPEDVVGRKSAMMQFCPDHTVFEFMLNNSRLTPAQIAQVRKDTLFSLDDFTFGRVAFCQNQVDVACLWEPDVSLALACRPGAHRLFSTADATNLIADVLLADKRLLDSAPDVAMKIARVFMEGADRIAADPAAAAHLVATVAPRFRDELKEPDTLKSFNWVRFTNLGDNAEFFGVGAAGGQVPFDRVYAQADTIWSQYPEAKLEERFSPAKYRDDRVIRRLWDAQKAIGKTPEPEQVRYDPKVAATADAVLAKPVSIHFAVNKAELDPEAMFLLKTQVLPQLANARGMSVRVEGNTDSTGDRGWNMKLSEKRAAVVAAYLVEVGAFPRERLASRGNGPDSPVASNAYEDGRAKNRRTDILFVRSLAASSPSPVF